MMVAVIILTALLSFQFVSAIERDCMAKLLMKNGRNGMKKPN